MLRTNSNNATPYGLQTLDNFTVEIIDKSGIDIITYQERNRKNVETYPPLFF